MKEIYTQVAAGKYRGKKLKLPSLETTRSTKSIIKESFFNTIQFDIIDAPFVEVFGGSGSMGIEAVSRGASHAYFIEKDKKAYEILKQNCKSVDISKFTCISGDTFEKLSSVANDLCQSAYFYFDPPFEYREGMDSIYDKCQKLLQMIPEEKIVMAVFEHMSILKMPQSIGNFTCKKSKKFGKSTLTYYISSSFL